MANLAVSGEVCPETGVWRMDGFPTRLQRFEKGDIFPYQLNGQVAHWRLLIYLSAAA